MTKQNKILIGAAIVLIVLGGGYAALKKARTASTPTTPDTSGASVTVTPEGLPAGATVTVTDRVNAELFAKTPRPSLTRSLPRGTIPQDAYAILVKHRAELVTTITSAPAAMSNWISLGIIHKQVGDYEGARIYWSYVETVNPENQVVHWNLGTLYENYLNDLSKAESEFRQVIAIDTRYIPAYIELSTMLSRQNKNDEALKVVSDGLIKNPSSTDLLIARAHLYRSMGDLVHARTAYDAAIAQANKDKNTQLVTELTSEKNALK